MKKKLLTLTSICMLTVLTGYSQQKGSKIENYLSKIQNLKAGHCKLGLGLDSVGKEGVDLSELSSKWIMKGDMVLVNAISTTNVDLLESDMIALGASDIKTRGSVVTAWVPMDKIASLDDCTTLNQVLPEMKPKLNVGLTTSQAVSTLFTGEASKIFNVNGSGIKIGILSDSFNTRGDADVTVSTGDLPGIGNPNGFTTPVVVLSELEGAGSDEGRGMAELVHDVAPGAELYFYSAFNGFFDFADGIRALADAGCDVIVDDIGYFAAPYFQDGAIAQAVDDVVGQGVVYLSSAGNSSRESYEDEYNEVTLGNDNLYDFGGGDITQSISIAPGEEINLWFQWDDPSSFTNADGPFPDTDIDVSLFNADTQALLDSSVFDNPTDGFPIEIINYTNNTNEPIIAELLVNRFSGPAPRRLKYINFQGAITYVEDFEGNNAGTCYGHSNAAGAIAVGAQAYFFNPEFGGALEINNFSSYGGVPILVDTDGNDIPEPIFRNKPEIVGTDFTNTTSFPNPAGNFTDIEGDGLPNFGGTSAAAPHIAAVVALMLEEKSDLTPAEVITILKETAIDMDDPFTPGFDVGYDIATGEGFVQADKALAALQEEPTVYRYQVYDSTTDEFIQTLTDETSVSLESIEGGLINIVALATDGLEEAESVELILTGTETREEQDSSAPFSLFGDDGSGDFRNKEINTGEYLISSTAFDQKNAIGTSGNTYSVSFGVAYEAFISSFILVNTDTNEDIMPLAETMDLSIFEETPNVTIRAEVGSSVGAIAFAEKVIFNLTGALEHYKEDITAPYALFGDSQGDFNGWNPSPIVGEYTIEATPHARTNGLGTEGITSSFSFNIIDNSFNSEESLSENTLSLDAASKTLTITSTNTVGVTFGIYNFQGINLFKGEVSASNKATVDMSSFNSGLFFVKSFDSESINSKIYINN